jgi:hypothetical protein
MVVVTTTIRVAAAMPVDSVADVVVEDVADETEDGTAAVIPETIVKLAGIAFARWPPAQKSSKEQSTAFWNCILRDTDSLGTRRRVTSLRNQIRLCRVRLLRSITYVKES